jgi:MiaB/RimO family radical SAM methylthiotransferase
MRTFYISTLGCKVNHYETEQIASLLRSRGLIQVQQPDAADLRLVNTCSVTIQAASKSRQAVRQLLRQPLGQHSSSPAQGTEDPSRRSRGQRVIVAGCWATSDPGEAAQMPGVSAVLGHRDNLAEQLDHLLTLWQNEDQKPPKKTPNTDTTADSPPSPEPLGNDGSMIEAGTLARQRTAHSKAQILRYVKENPAHKHGVTEFLRSAAPVGAATLPQLNSRQDGHQRAFLKIQDGCDAHCTYCIIPSLRPVLWSRLVGEVVAEACRLVEAGHIELVLTGIFLGAYGQLTALRRRQQTPSGQPLSRLIEALCTQVSGLRRLRLSSLESGDLSDALLATLRAHPQVVPHFHLPLQSGSDVLLRRMNRQYSRGEFLAMVDRLREAFDRPALTTDIIVGFPGETDKEFQQTLEVVDQAGFIHIHAFSFSPRPGTAAARWTGDFIHGPIVNERIDTLRQRAVEHSLAFRRQFVGKTVEVMVERPNAEGRSDAQRLSLQHGRCERYFPVYFEFPRQLIGQCVRVRIDRVTAQRTFGTLDSAINSE